jgi:hypothetical protein
VLLVLGCGLAKPWLTARLTRPGDQEIVHIAGVMNEAGLYKSVLGGLSVGRCYDSFSVRSMKSSASNAK